MDGDFHDPNYNMLPMVILTTALTTISRWIILTTQVTTTTKGTLLCNLLHTPSSRGDLV